MVKERNKKPKNAHKLPQKIKQSHNVEEVDTDIIPGRRKMVVKHLNCWLMGVAGNAMNGLC